MITIINQEKPAPLIINKDLLYKYKEETDICLVNIRGELTRSLVDYKIFQQLQQVNNYTFVIIDYLDSEHYTDLKTINDDKAILSNNIDKLLNHCKNCVNGNIYDSIYNNCVKLVITIHKLVQIVKTINNKGNN